MGHNVEHPTLTFILWPRHWFLWLLRTQLFHCVVILSLFFRHKNVLPSEFFLLLVEVVDDDTNEQVESAETSENDKGYEIDVVVHAVLMSRLLVNVRHVNSVVHDRHPTLKCGHL